MRHRALPLLVPLALVLGAAPAAAQGPSRQEASVESADQQYIDTAPPSVALAGFPRRGCVRRDVRARVRVDDTSALRGVVVRLNGRKLKGTKSKRFKVRVRKARMRSGQNRLTITAVDRRGNRFVRTLRFPRCP